MSETRLVRFDKVTRVVHWFHVASFLGLLFTGLTLYARFLNPLATVVGGVRNAVILHKAAAVVFVAAPFWYLFSYWPVVRKEVREVFSWSRDDTAWMKAFPRFFFSPDLVSLPPQGMYKAGQKINVALTIVCCLGLAVTGAVMWAPRVVSAAAIPWTIMLHDVMALGLFAVVLGHVYLGVVFRPFRGALSSMVDGTVPEHEAREWHNKWYRERTAASPDEEGPAGPGR